MTTDSRGLRAPTRRRAHRHGHTPDRRRRLIASDFFTLLRPSECDRRVWLRERGVEEAPPGPYARALMDQGIAHERRHLAEVGEHVDLGSLRIDERAERTLELIAERERVIYQGAFRVEATIGGVEAEVVGVPDFVLATGSGHIIRDSKLARRVGGGRNAPIELQLGLYGWLYEQSTGLRPDALEVHNGAGEIVEVLYDGGEAALEALERILADRLLAGEPDEPVGWGKCSGCGFFDRCWPRAVESRSVGLLPWAGAGVAQALGRRGVRTIDELLERHDAESLAQVERPWGDGTRRIGADAERILASARALTEDRPIVLGTPALPDRPSYVMLDLEGMPARLDEREVIYLWGLQVFGDRAGEFRAATAGFGSEGDREGWTAFLAAAGAVFAEHGEIPFVHWASYERQKIDLYVDRYGDQDGVAARVRDNLVDLLPITFESVALPVSSYGLKTIERLAGFERRLEEYGGDWSMARYIEANETGDDATRAEIMDQILAYNREDLEATWAVMRWLRALTSPGGPATPHRR